MNELPRPEPKTTDKTQEEVFATAVSATAAKQGRNWHPAQDEIAEDAIKLWPPNGIVPENLGATDLHNALFDLHKSEADEKSKLTGKREAPRKTRSLDTCEDFLKNQHSKK